MKRRVFGLVLCVLAAFVIISCSAKADRNLVGVWEGTDGLEKVEFSNNMTFRGTMIWDMQKTPVELAGTYALKGDLIDLKVNRPESLTPMTWKVTFSGKDQVTFLYQKGGMLKVDGTSGNFRRKAT